MAPRLARQLILLSFVILSGCTWIFSGLERREYSSSGCSSSPSTTTYESGAGSSSDPYLICSLTQWKLIGTKSNDWSRSFRLAADLDFSGETVASLPAIGTSGNPFTGSLNGAGYSMRNISLTGTASGTAAMFAYVGSATFENLRISNASFVIGAGNSAGFVSRSVSGASVQFSNVTMTNMTIGGAFPGGDAGGLIGTASGSTVSFTNITGSQMTLSNGAGGLSETIGVMNLSGVQLSAITGGHALARTVNNGVTASNVTITGLVGASSPIEVLTRTQNSSFSSVRVSGTISASSISNYAGGLIGGTTDSAAGFTLGLTDCSFTGTIASSFGNYYGGLIGLANSNNFNGQISLSRCAVNATITSTTATVAYVGGIFGVVYGAAATPTLVTDSYVVGNLTGSGAVATSSTGIIAGTNLGDLSVTRSFFAGATSGVFRVGCVIGDNFNLLGADSFYNSTVCGGAAFSVSGGSTGTTGQTTGFLQPAAAFTNWSTTNWIFSSGSYPRLVWE